MAKDKPSKIEQETIIVFNEEEDSAECFTYNRKLTNRLRKLCRERGNEIKEIRDNSVGGLTFTFPKSWVKVQAPRVISDEQRAILAERLAGSLGRQANT